MQVFGQSLEPTRQSLSPLASSPQACMASVARSSPPPPPGSSPPVAPSARDLPVIGPRTIPEDETTTARGTDAHAAAAVLQRSFHRGRFNQRNVRLGERTVQVAPPTGLAAAMHQARRQ